MLIRNQLRLAIASTAIGVVIAALCILRRQSPSDESAFPSDQPYLVVKPATRTAISGIPVLIYMIFVNPTPIEYSFWLPTNQTWRGPNGQTYSPSDDDYCSNYTRCSDGAAVRIPARHHVVHLARILTPSQFGNGTKWDLVLEGGGGWPVDQPLKISSRRPSSRPYVQTEFQCRDREPVCESPGILDKCRQAALIEEAVWYGTRLPLDGQNPLPAIEHCAEQGDWQARAMLFVRAVVDGEQIYSRWEDILDAPIEVQAVCSLHLLRLLDGRSVGANRPGRSRYFSVTERNALLATIRGEDHLTRWLRVHLNYCPKDVFSEESENRREYSKLFHEFVRPRPGLVFPETRFKGLSRILVVVPVPPEKDFRGTGDGPVPPEKTSEGRATGQARG